MAKKKATTSLSVSTADNITIAGGGGQLHTLKKRQKTALNRR
ncbi:hypothetical protein [Candidatus Arsenophonus nilaparvatae]|nr:hypothetical protein [Candidatus Arsenophonus nilaparvatae]